MLDGMDLQAEYRQRKLQDDQRMVRRSLIVAWGLVAVLLVGKVIELGIEVLR